MSWDVWLAGALALPQLLAVGAGYASGPRPLLQSAFRTLDRRLGYSASQLGWLAFAYLSLRPALAAAWSPDVSVASTVLLFMTGVTLCIALCFPVAAVWSLVLWFIYPNEPFIRDIERHLPSHRELRRQWRRLHEQLRTAETHLSLPQMGEVLHDNGLTDLVTSDDSRRAWRVLWLRAFSRDFDAPLAWFPTLQPFLDDRIAMAIFSVLEPGARVRPHRGYFKGVLRYQLCLEVSESDRVWIEVAGRRHHWTEGEAVMFDDMFVHEAANESSKRRVVLYLDVARRLPPLLDAINLSLIRFFGAHPFAHKIERNAAPAARFAVS